MNINELNERFGFRNIRPEEAGQAAEIERICFPSNEACTETMMRERAASVPDLFLVAVDHKTRKLAGFLNGLATNEHAFRDEFFTDSGLHDPDGENIMLLGLDVLPEYRAGTGSRDHAAVSMPGSPAGQEDADSDLLGKQGQDV